MRRADAIIAGGGVIGLMTGWVLARAGLHVIVVDAGGPAATNAAAGMLAPSFESTLHKAEASLAAFGKESLNLWKKEAPFLSERSGIATDFDEGGILSAIFSEEEAGGFEKDFEGGAYLNRRETLELEPSLSPAVLGGWFAEGEGQIDPRRALQALRAAFLNDGGALRSNLRVVEILSAGGKSSGIRLDNGEAIYAPNVVVAAGARIAGLSDLPEGAVFPVKGEALALARVEGSPTRVVRSSRAYLCPKSDGRVVIGATSVGGDWSLTTDNDRVRALGDGAAAAFPALNDAKEIERWAGLRPATKDDAPVIGPAPRGPKGLIYAFGHYRNGVLFAPATAAAVAEIITAGRVPASIAAFSAARFDNLGVC